MTKKVSVIITTYNDAGYLKKSIPSVLQQSAFVLELLIIDDGSVDDKAQKIVSAFQEKADINLKYYKKENGGPSSARNYGIQKAKGEFIAFLDSDDQFSENSVKLRLKAFNALSDDYGGVYGTSLIFRKKSRVILEDVYLISGFLGEKTKLIGRKGGISGSALSYLFRKDALVEINGFNESLKFNEDFELLLRIGKKWKFHGIENVVFKRFARSDSWSKSNSYKAYEGVKEFLVVAERDNLLDQDEIEQREKENTLSLVKKLIEQRVSWKEISPFVKQAFLKKKPTNIKEHIVKQIDNMYMLFS